MTQYCTSRWSSSSSNFNLCFPISLLSLTEEMVKEESYSKLLVVKPSLLGEFLDGDPVALVVVLEVTFVDNIEGFLTALGDDVEWVEVVGGSFEVREWELGEARRARHGKDDGVGAVKQRSSGMTVKVIAVIVVVVVVVGEFWDGETQRREGREKKQKTKEEEKIKKSNGVFFFFFKFRDKIVF